MGLYEIELARHRVQYANHIYPHTLGYRSAFENMPRRGKRQRVAQEKEPASGSDGEEEFDDNREEDKAGSDTSDNGSSCLLNLDYT